MDEAFGVGYLTCFGFVLQQKSFQLVMQLFKILKVQDFQRFILCGWHVCYRHCQVVYAGSCDPERDELRIQLSRKVKELEVRPAEFSDGETKTEIDQHLEKLEEACKQLNQAKETKNDQSTARSSTEGKTLFIF